MKTRKCSPSLMSNNGSAPPIKLICSNLIKPLLLLRENCWSTELTTAVSVPKAIKKGSKSDNIRKGRQLEKNRSNSEPKYENRSSEILGQFQREIKGGIN